MSKLSFRARALDAAKPLPVYRHTDLPELSGCVSVNRAVPRMPTGMETEEELELHLQRALSVPFRKPKENLVIPVPEAQSINMSYDKLYRGDVRVPPQLIHTQPLTLDLEELDYDLDSEDELLMMKLNRRMEVRPLQFENMMDRLEKASTHQPLSLSGAKLMLHEDDDLLECVYEYWLKKRRTCQSASLIPQVKRERRYGSTDDAYVAFRRRTEKMQTRRNRKSDLASYERMLRLRREFSFTVSILEMVKRREKSKRDLLHLTLELVKRRYQLGDFSGDVLRKTALSLPLVEKPVYCTPVTATPCRARLKRQIKRAESEELSPDLLRPKKKKTRVRRVRSSCPLPGTLHTVRQTHRGHNHFMSSGDEDAPPVSQDEENNPEGVFVFRRKAECQYLCPRTMETTGPQLLPHSPGLCSTPLRMGPNRRRMGRGGRILVDRAPSVLEPILKHPTSRGSGSIHAELVPLDRKPPLTAPPSLSNVLYNVQNLRRFSSAPRPCQDQREDTRLDHSRPSTRCPSAGGVTKDQFKAGQQELVQMLKQQLAQKNKASWYRFTAHDSNQVSHQPLPLPCRTPDLQ